MNTKKIPALVMLAGGSVTAIVSVINRYELLDMLTYILITLIVFLIIGIAVKLIFDSFHIEEPDEDRVDDDGEVVEKTEIPDGEENAEDAEAALSEEGEKEDEAGA